MVQRQRRVQTARPSPVRPQPVGWRLARIHRRIAQLAVMTSKDTILDLHGGDGALLDLLGRQTGPRLAGICATPQLARAARAALPEADIMFAQPDDLPWVGESFEVLVCAAAQDMLTMPKEAFDEAYRVLKPGGQLLFAVGDLPRPLGGWFNQWVAGGDKQDPYYLHSKARILSWLKTAGFERLFRLRVAGFSVLYVAWKP